MTIYVINLFLAVCLVFGSCNARQSTIDPKVMDIFNDFGLVGHGAATFENDGGVDRTHVVPHDEREKPTPNELQTRTQYVFHYRNGRGDPERLGAEILPSRLRALGFEVLEAPKYKGGNFSYPYIGGPYFSITFQGNGHRGVIFNRVHGEMPSKTWIVEDYVLVLLS